MPKSREKGKRGELELSKELKKLGINARRGQQYCGIGGADVVGLPGVHIECKRTEKLQLWKAMQQAHADANGDVPTVMHRASRQPWMVTVCLSDLLALVEAMKGLVK